MELKPGDTVPNFKLESDSGGHISPASLRGRPFVIYFYPKDNTPGCTREAVDFSKNIKKFEKLGVVVVGVSKDDPASHARFRAKHALKVALASDPDIATATAFGVWGEKSLYGRKFMGMERSTFLVDAKGKIRGIWRKVRVPGHVEAVLEAAKAL